MFALVFLALDFVRAILRDEYETRVELVKHVLSNNLEQVKFLEIGSTAFRLVLLLMLEVLVVVSGRVGPHLIVAASTSSTTSTASAPIATAVVVALVIGVVAAVVVMVVVMTSVSVSATVAASSVITVVMVVQVELGFLLVC